MSEGSSSARWCKTPCISKGKKHQGPKYRVLFLKALRMQCTCSSMVGQHWSTSGIDIPLIPALQGVETTKKHEIGAHHYEATSVSTMSSFIRRNVIEVLMPRWMSISVGLYISCAIYIECIHLCDWTCSSKLQENKSDMQQECQ